MIELFIFISCILAALAHIISAAKNGCYYAVRRKDFNNKHLKKYIENMHRLQTPFWYALFGSVFFLVVSLLLTTNNANSYLNASLREIIITILRAIIITMSCSAIASPFYQGVINLGAGKPFIDKNEKRSFEFIWGDFSIWIPKFWYGHWRILISIFSLFTLIFSVFFM